MRRAVGVAVPPSCQDESGGIPGPPSSVLFSPITPRLVSSRVSSAGFAALCQTPSYESGSPAAVWTQTVRASSDDRRGPAARD